MHLQSEKRSYSSVVYFICLVKGKQKNHCLQPLIDKQRVRVEVADVDFLALFYDLWMFLLHDPTNVGEEKASLCVVRIRVSFA